MGDEVDEGERFERIFREHASRVYRFCLRRTGDWATAEDLTSVVFYEAWRRRTEIDFRTRDILPWLYGVARNVVRSHSRSLRRQRAAMARLPRPLPEVEFVDDITQRLDASSRAGEVLELIRRLPPGEREVLRLCVTDDLTYQAAADMLGLPIGTVRSRLFRARGRLDALGGRARERGLVRCRSKDHHKH